MKNNKPIKRLRVNEIIFYNYIKRLEKTYSNSAIMYDLIALFATVSGLNITVLNTLTSSIILGTSDIIPSKEEQIITYKQLGMSMRQIRKATGIPLNSQYAILSRVEDPSDYIRKPKTTEEQYIAIEQFLKALNKFKEV